MRPDRQQHTEPPLGIAFEPHEAMGRKRIGVEKAWVGVVGWHRSVCGSKCREGTARTEQTALNVPAENRVGMVLGRTILGVYIYIKFARKANERRRGVWKRTHTFRICFHRARDA